MPTPQFFNFFFFFFFMECYMSDEELKLQAMLVTEGAGEARQGPDGMSSALSDS